MNKILIEEPKRPELFNGSKEYWDKRYSEGGNSGSGSYNRLGIYKAETVNEFLEEKNIKSCIEWGCGDGNQLSLMNYKEYLGIDISKKAIEINREKFKNDSSKRFMVLDDNLSINKKYDMAISLDVIYHLVEDDVFEKYMRNLFAYADKYVCVYASNTNSQQCGYYNHMKHRKFTDFIDKNFKSWSLIEYIENRYPFDERDCANTSFSNFYFFGKDSLVKGIIKKLRRKTS